MTAVTGYDLNQKNRLEVNLQLLRHIKTNLLELMEETGDENLGIQAERIARAIEGLE